MSLPFLKLKKDVGASASMLPDTITREPDEASEDGDMDGLEVAAHDLLDAIHRKDAKALAEALQAAISLCQSSEPQEGTL